MRSLTAGLVLLVSAFVAKADEPKVSWTKYSFKPGNTLIQFPGKGQEKPIDNGRQISLDALDGKAGYLMLATDFPRPVKLDAAAAKRLLDGSATAVTLFKGKILSQQDIRLGKYAGRAIDVEAPGFGLYRTRLYVTPTRLYQVIVVGPKEFVNGATAKKFFQSFKLDE